MKHEIYVIGKSGVSSGAAAQHDIQYVQCYQWYSLYVYIYIYMLGGPFQLSIFSKSVKMDLHASIK